MVRHALLPWLKNHAQHPSNWNLRAEDLDRRTMILNKWWIALLEMIDGGSSYTVSSTDRPPILDGIVGIMTRPEWRSLPSSQRHTSQAALGQSHSSMSLESTGSDFLTESTYHNTRNLFTSNLLTQTSIVVDQLSLRQATATLVTFGAKTLAYSFYFCPGVAEVLVRLWATPSSNIRHVAAEWDLLGPGTTTDLDALFSEFPKHLSTLRFTSYASTVRHLRRAPAMMLTIRNIRWHGHWTTRWCGRESDLLFVFIKQWHILLEDYLPVSITARDRARSPALVLVYAQLMNVLQSTFQSPAGSLANIAINNNSPATTFDDVLANADASAAALPLPATNVARQMAENRLVMLMRDVLSGRPSGVELASRTFATCAVKLLQATARRISKFDHDACFTLCDFLEEVIYILDRYQAANSSLPEIIDWTFWLDVCKHMSENENVMTEIRLFAFLYSIWGIWTQDPVRKNELCRNWLLTRETFDRFFFHWCPMTRAYYMRLLCWRVARISGPSPSAVDM